MQLNATALAGIGRAFLAKPGSYLATHVLGSLLAYVLLVPLFSLLFNRVVSWSGAQALSDQEILYFALSPLGLLSLLLVGAAGLLLMVFKHSALMAVAYGVQHGQRVTTLQALAFVARRSRRILVLGLRIVLRVLLLVVPCLLALALIYRALLGDYDINFYLAERPPAFWAAAALGAICVGTLIALLLRLAIGWFFALPLALFTPQPTAEVLALSAAAGGTRRRTVLAWVVAWAVLDLLLLSLAAVVVDGLGEALIPGLLENIRLLVLTLGMLLLLSALLALIVTAVSASALAIVMVQLFEACGLDAGRAYLAESIEAGTGTRVLLTNRRIIAASALSLLAAVAISRQLIEGLTLQDHVSIIAHRGASGAAPENTLAAIREALRQGADWVEIDVQESADGEVVVLHDSDLKKVAGRDLKIWDATLPDLADIDIGSWFDPRFSGERVPTLRQVLDLCRGSAGVVIELKYYGHNERLEERVAAVVEAAGMEDDVMLMSLDYAGTQRMRELRPDWPVGLLTSVMAGKLEKLALDFYAVNTRFGSRQFVGRAHQQGRRVMVWTVNDGVSMSQMMSRGVDGVITDYPDRGREVLAQRAALNSGQRLLIELASYFGHQPQLAAQ